MQTCAKTILISVLVVLLLATFILSAGCGYQQTLREHCHVGDEQTCNNLFGRNQSLTDDELLRQAKNIENQRKEIDSLHTMVSLLMGDLQVSAAAYTSLNKLLNQLLLTSGANTTMISDLQNDVNAAVARVDNQQTIINDMVGNIVALEAQDVILEYILPCGDRPGVYDETIMRTKSSKLIAYFESGTNRFMTVLEPSTVYSTTDQAPRCLFSTDANLNIIEARR